MPAVRSELESLVRDAQTAQRACVAEWRQCLGCDPKRWSVSSCDVGGQPGSTLSTVLTAGESTRLLTGCENEYVDVPFRMAMAIQAENRANQRLQRLSGGNSGM